MQYCITATLCPSFSLLVISSQLYCFHVRFSHFRVYWDSCEKRKIFFISRRYSDISLWCLICESWHNHEANIKSKKLIERDSSALFKNQRFQYINQEIKINFLWKISTYRRLFSSIGNLFYSKHVIVIFSRIRFAKISERYKTRIRYRVSYSQRKTETEEWNIVVTLCILSFFFSRNLRHNLPIFLRSLERTTHLILDVRDFTMFLFHEQCFISATRSLSLNDKWHDGERVRASRYSSFRSRYTSFARTEINQRCCINPFSPLLFYHQRIAS